MKATQTSCYFGKGDSLKQMKWFTIKWITIAGESPFEIELTVTDTGPTYQLKTGHMDSDLHS